MKINLNELLVSADKVASLDVASRLLSARRITVNGILMLNADVELKVGDEVQIGNAQPFPFTESLAQKVSEGV